MRLYELYQVRSACFKIYHSTCRTPNEDISRRPSDMTSWGEALVMLPIYGRECHGRRSNFGKDWGDGYLPVSSRLNFLTSFGYLEVFCVNQCFLFNCLFSFFWVGVIRPVFSQMDWKIGQDLSHLTTQETIQEAWLSWRHHSKMLGTDLEV